MEKVVESSARNLSEGDSISAHGKMSFYTRGGTTDFMVDLAMPEGVGELALELERLKQKLSAEGLFETSRKRPLPRFPKKVGVVTSPTSAVFQDILHIVGRRYPLAEVVLAPTVVQGEQAAPNIVWALDLLDREALPFEISTPCDVCGALDMVVNVLDGHMAVGHDPNHLGCATQRPIRVCFGFEKLLWAEGQDDSFIQGVVIARALIKTVPDFVEVEPCGFGVRGTIKIANVKACVSGICNAVLWGCGKVCNSEACGFGIRDIGKVRNTEACAFGIRDIGLVKVRDTEACTFEGYTFDLGCLYGRNIKACTFEG